MISPFWSNAEQTKVTQGQPFAAPRLFQLPFLGLLIKQPLSPQ
jgi:hypothetical protein